jgi:hypothetical protein
MTRALTPSRVASSNPPELLQPVEGPPVFPDVPPVDDEPDAPPELDPACGSATT